MDETLGTNSWYQAKMMVLAINKFISHKRGFETIILRQKNNAVSFLNTAVSKSLVIGNFTV